MTIYLRQTTATAVAAMLLVILAGCNRNAPTNSAAGSATPSTSPTGQTSRPAPDITVPAGLAAGIAVYDRQAGAFTVERNIHQGFRSASLVKLLIALDYLWDRDTIPDADRDRLDLMLSRSDDDAATYFYSLGGKKAIIRRMVERLGLQDTTPPSAPRTGWGSTQVSAADLIRVYRYILDEAPGPISKFIMDNLRQGSFTRCGTDGYDQSFGIPTAFKDQPWAAKQGWYEFAGAPQTCTDDRPAAFTSAQQSSQPATVLAAAPTDWEGEVLHTTGIVGAEDRTIMVVLTVHPPGTSYAKATQAVTQLAKSLPLTK